MAKHGYKIAPSPESSRHPLREESNTDAPASFGVRRTILGPPRLLPFLLRNICAALALVQVWHFRGYLDPDGVSYSDLAKALTRGDWHNGLSSYWSPLYSFLLAIGYLIFKPGIHWQIFISQAINFIGFLASILAWEWLLNEWERWKGPPLYRSVADAVGYAVIAWGGLHLVGLRFTSSDMEVMALTLGLGALLIRIRSGNARRTDFIWIGLALGIAFLAKAATISLIVIVLCELAFLVRKSPRLFFSSLAVGCVVVLPFVVALSVAKGHLSISDTGRLNYSWEVTGMSVEGYKDNPNIPNSPVHPFTRVLDVPRVIGYEKHLVGTLPIHFDPSWWCEGYPSRFNFVRQLLVVKSNIGYIVTRFALCPAAWFAVLCCCCGGMLKLYRRFTDLWFIWLPALAVIGSYCLVYSLGRYFGGAFVLLGFALLASSWNIRMPRLWMVKLIPVAIILLFGVVFRVETVQPVRKLLEVARGREDPLAEAQMRIAETMLKHGFRSGEQVGLVGNALLVSWLHLLEGRAVAVVPMTIEKNEGILGRPLLFKFDNSVTFWRADPQVRMRVLDAFRREGASWVFASDVPVWADVSGWQVAGDFVTWTADSRPYMYFQRLSPPSQGSNLVAANSVSRAAAWRSEEEECLSPPEGFGEERPSAHNLPSKRTPRECAVQP